MGQEFMPHLSESFGVNLKSALRHKNLLLTNKILLTTKQMYSISKTRNSEPSVGRSVRLGPTRNKFGGYQDLRLSGSACLPVGRDIRTSGHQVQELPAFCFPDILIPYQGIFRISCFGFEVYSKHKSISNDRSEDGTNITAERDLQFY